MAAKRKPERKADVLNAMADYLLGSGVSEATLRPAATALGTSPRMLLYHFRSKEALLVAALQEVRRREIDMLVRALIRNPGGPTAERMRHIWRWYASPRRAPYLRLFFEAWGVSLQRPYLYEGFLESVRKDLLPVAEEALVQLGYPRRDARAIATFMIAALRGLLIDLVANKDRRRLDDAMEIFIQLTRMVETKRVSLPARAPRAVTAARSPAGVSRRTQDRRRRHAPEGAPVHPRRPARRPAAR